MATYEINNRVFEIEESELDELYSQYGYEYCSEKCPDDCLYDMYEFDELMSDYTPTELAQRVFFGDFNPNHDYFYFNGYANLESWEWSAEEYYKDNIDEDYFLEYCEEEGYLDDYEKEEEED